METYLECAWSTFTEVENFCEYSRSRWEEDRKNPLATGKW